MRPWGSAQIHFHKYHPQRNGSFTYRLHVKALNPDRRKSRALSTLAVIVSKFAVACNVSSVCFTPNRICASPLRLHWILWVLTSGRNWLNCCQIPIRKAVMKKAKRKPSHNRGVVQTTTKNQKFARAFEKAHGRRCAKERTRV